jgi:phage gp29-like protein
MPTPSAVLRRGIASALQSISGVINRKPDPKPSAVNLETILLPHARTRWMLPAASGMTPASIESILKEALTGKSPRREQELYSLMESTWPRLLKNSMEIKDAVLSLDWTLMDPPAGESIPGAKDLVDRARNGMKGDPVSDGHGWRATLDALLDAWTRGISISEIQWEYRGGKSPAKPSAWLPALTRDLPAWHYGWATGPWGSSQIEESANDGRLMLYPNAGTPDGIPFPADKFLIAIRKAGKGHPSGTALLRCLAWWWCSANFSAEWLLNFAQIFGQPFRWATYDSSQEGVKEDLQAMMEAMGSSAYGVGPDGTKIEWHESSKNGADNPQAHILKLADEACDLLVLGQTLTATVGQSGSLALGEVHQSIRADVIDSAAAWLAEILNEQLIPSIIRLNYGDAGEDSALPYFQPARKSQKDTKAIAETFKVLLDAGVPLVRTQVYDMLDLAAPTPEDATIGGTPLRPALPAVPGTPSALTAEASPDIRRFLAKLPLDAREYFMARLLES